jgi:uncharacterized RDD family membrane protein YckC
MPQGGESGHPRETGQQTETPGQQYPGGRPGQGPVPGQSGTAGQGGVPNQPGPQDQQWAGEPWGQQQYGYGAPPQGGAPGQWGMGGPMQGMPISPVNEIETRVTGRRLVQYIIDAIIFGIVASLVSWALNRGTGGVHAILVLVLVLVDIAWYLLYWAQWPFMHGGRTVGMQVMGIRVISIKGGPASFLQLAVRSVLLVLFSPVSVLVGWIVMMCSRYRQRTGDHMAKTMVVRARVEPVPARPEYVGAGQTRDCTELAATGGSGWAASGGSGGPASGGSGWAAAGPRGR